MKMNYMKQTNASKLLSVEHSVSTETAGDCCFLFAMQSYPKAKARAANIENKKKKNGRTISTVQYPNVGIRMCMKTMNTATPLTTNPVFKKLSNCM